MAGHVARVAKMRNIEISVGKPEKKRPLGRPRRRWVNNIKMNIKYGMDWILLVQGRVQWCAIVDIVMKIRFSIKGGRFLDQLSDIHCQSGTLLCRVNIEL
jgi:hypothetical protein